MRLIPALLIMTLLTACGGGPPHLSTPTPAPVFVASPTLRVTPAPREISVIGYFPDYRELNPAWTANLTDIIYFSAEPRADGSLDTSRLNEATWQVLKKIKTQNGTRLHLSIGGWERSSGFAAMTADPITRQSFISSLTEFALTHSLDGVDFDWEFPEDETEFANYVLLLGEMKEAFSRHEMIVSVALSPDPNFPLGSFDVVDRVHIMSYDRAAQHSTYEQALEDIQIFLDAGLPREKLMLGIPFYGRNIQPPYRVLAYEQIMTQYHPAPRADEVDGIFFNGIETVQHKTCYALQEGLGGVMVWELAHDTTDNTSLLKTIFEISVGRKPC